MDQAFQPGCFARDPDGAANHLRSAPVFPAVAPGRIAFQHLPLGVIRWSGDNPDGMAFGDQIINHLTGEFPNPGELRREIKAEDQKSHECSQGSKIVYKAEEMAKR